MLFEQFCRQISDYAPSQTEFLLGFSGGLDSSALLGLFAELRKKQPHFMLRAIHIHHGLSRNADQWAQHCQNLCQQLEIPLIIEKVRVDTRAGIEAGARDARYSAIKKHLHENEILVTAHHQQDQTETFFLALKRGSGLQGLSAMAVKSAVNNLPIFRPLLPFSRAQLEDYVRALKLPWIEDESNADNHYERNFLRHQILPRLRRRWPHFDHAVQRSARHCFEQQQLIDELINRDFQQYYAKSDRTFDISGFAQFSVLRQKALLRRWLAALNLAMPSVVQLEQLITDVISARADRNPQFHWQNQVIRRYRNRLYLTENFADLSKIRLDIQPNQTIALPDNLGTLRLHETQEGLLAQWQHYHQPLPTTDLPIQIRFAYSGAVRNKNGVNQDIKKLWQQAEVPVWQRRRIPLIFYGEQFKSAVGFFVDSA
ncbi:tRNA lysidine(34) synthetase TilS [Necropsobacter massiliensis]|uniref:tRNA lysidine(34) synthetase TilS n=1 Tax=Necropsobacter massiliensis TaxID=1400001 RepID=UPI000595A9DA|nr:tRNA lysidine(34) synthetase TilS [Necropsobacter massiliensis]